VAQGPMKGVQGMHMQFKPTPCAAAEGRPGGSAWADVVHESEGFADVEMLRPAEDAVPRE